MAEWSPVALWAAVIGSGLYHGLNPGMGWPLAVSAGLMERSPRGLWQALGPLSVGHLLAMIVVILPFSMLLILAYWQREIQVTASLLVLAFGLYKLIDRRHPRALARIRPTQLGLWSFAVAIAHGAGLMLVPIYLGICRSLPADVGHQAAGALMAFNLSMALLVAIVHSLAMIASGGAMAWLAYRWLGTQFIARSWFNLDALWAMSLIVVGGTALSMTIAGHG